MLKGWSDDGPHFKTKEKETMQGKYQDKTSANEQ
jgi:hypothetical protein